MKDNMFYKCPACSSSSIKKVFTTYDRHYGHFDKLYDLFSCNNCGLLFLNPMISSDELHRMYPTDTYYAYKKSSVTKSSPYISSGLRKLLRSIYNFLYGNKKNKLVHKSEDKILDIGCGSGGYLRNLRNSGHKNIYGVEISEPAAKAANDDGLNVFNGVVNKAGFQDSFFDFIRLNHSFEHLVNPGETLKEIHRILKPDGDIFIGVPNTDSLPYKIFGMYWYYLGVPFHPYNYNVKNLSIFLEKHGFEVKKVLYCGYYPGITGSLQIFFNRNKRKKSSEGLADNMISRLLLNPPAKFLNFFKAGDCIEILAKKKG